MPDTTLTATVTTTPAAPLFVDANNDGLPDNLAEFLDRSDFKMDWENRRKAIFWTLKILGLVFLLCSGVALYLAVFKPTLEFNREISGLLQTLIASTLLAYMGVLTAYVFGAQFDVNSFRTSTASIVSSVANNRMSAGVYAANRPGAAAGMGVGAAQGYTDPNIPSFG